MVSGRTKSEAQRGFGSTRLAAARNRPVVRLEVRPLHLAFEDVELVAKHQDLHLLSLLGAKRDYD
jgi:hypothetical protein